MSEALVGNLPDLAEKYVRLGRERLRGIESALHLLESNPGDESAWHNLQFFFRELGRSSKSHGSPSVLLPKAGRRSSGAPAASSRFLTRSAFRDAVRAAFSDKRRNRRGPTVLAMLAIDELAGIADGHRAAARALALAPLTRLLERQLRARDAIGQQGDGRFGVLLPDAREQDAVRLLRRVLQEFAAMEHKTPGGSAFRATLSAGLAVLDRERMTAEEWMRVAESGLEAARTLGPNQIVTTSSPSAEPNSAGSPAAADPAGEDGDALLMNGELGEINVPELLQIFELHGPVDIRLRLDTPLQGRGEIYISGGKLLHAGLGPMVGEKALLRLFSWDDGQFRAEKRRYRGEPTLAIPLQECLLRAATQLDEVRRMREMLEERGPALVVHRGDTLGTLAREEAAKTVLAVVEEHGEIDRILDASPYSDVVTLRILQQLLDAGALTFAAPHQMADWWEFHRPE